MSDNNNFNELLIHTLKQIHVRLDRLEAKIDEKTDKADLKAVEQRFDSVENRLDSVENRLGPFSDGCPMRSRGHSSVRWPSSTPT